MKKVVFSVMAIALVSLGSCRKDRTCTCVDSDDGYTEVYTIPNSSASEAKVLCDANDYQGSTYNTECSITN